ncbi:MAG: hypothetical protein ACXWL2_04395 [Candidatus Chromulinivorax sp.]
MKTQLYILLIIINLHSLIFSRSIHRKPNSTIPYITVSSENKEYAHKWVHSNSEKKIHKFQNKYLRLKTLKTFEKSNIRKQLLPNHPINYRKGNGAVDPQILKQENEILLQEILDGKKHFTYFTVLSDVAFNYKNNSGFIALKYNNYPFVLKLFIEHPDTFIQPFNKGFKAKGLFVLNGNMRHLSGFTRIPNLEQAKKLLAKDAQYRYYLDFPRKWYWIPKKEYSLTINWYDDNNQHYETLKIPGVYGIVCDYIEVDKKIQKQEINTLRQISVDVGSYLHNIIDSNVENFVPEKDSNKIVIIDTEHFPTMTGLEKEMSANGYVQWYIELAGKYIKTAFLRSKQKRISDQSSI